MSPLRIAVGGAGGVGGYFGARLARAGERVVFIARGEHLRWRSAAIACGPAGSSTGRVAGAAAHSGERRAHHRQAVEIDRAQGFVAEDPGPAGELVDRHRPCLIAALSGHRVRGSAHECAATRTSARQHAHCAQAIFERPLPAGSPEPAETPAGSASTRDRRLTSLRESFSGTAFAVEPSMSRIL